MIDETEPEPMEESRLDPIAEADRAAISRTKERLMAKMPSNLHPLIPSKLTDSEQVEWMLLLEEAGIFPPPNRNSPDTSVARKAATKPINLTAMERIKIGLSAGGLK